MIRITKNSIVYHPIGEREPHFVDDSDLPLYLSDVVKIGKNVTFERIFDLIVLHKDLFNGIFNFGCLHGYEVDMYLEEYNKDIEPNGDITYMECYWGCDYWNFNEDDKEVSMYPAFHGKKENYTDKYQTEPCDMNIGVSGHIGEYKKLPFKINENAYFGEVKDGKYQAIMEGNCEMTLFDMIRGILHEISFYGTPQQYDEKMDELAETVERIKSGEEKMYELKGWDEETKEPNFVEVPNPYKKDNDCNCDNCECDN